MDSEFPNCSQRWFPKDGVKGSAATYALWQPATLDLLLQNHGRACMGLAPALLPKEHGVCRATKGMPVVLAVLQSHFTSLQQPHKTPLYFASTFNQTFTHLNEHQRKEIGNIFTLEKQNKRRLCEMPSVTLISPGESPQLDFFIKGLRSQKSYYMSKIKSCKRLRRCSRWVASREAAMKPHIHLLPPTTRTGRAEGKSLSYE